MSLTDISEVIIGYQEPLSTQSVIDALKEKRRYLQIKIADEKQEKIIVLISDRKLDSHEVMKKRFQRNIIQDRDLEIHLFGEGTGGGEIELTENILTVSGTSLFYGKANHERTAEILRKHFKKNNIQIEVRTEPAK